MRPYRRAFIGRRSARTALPPGRPIFAVVTIQTVPLSVFGGAVWIVAIEPCNRINAVLGSFALRPVRAAHLIASG